VDARAVIDAAITMLVPPGTTPGAALALLCLSFFTSALTGALGLGGGVMMLAAMTQLLPPAVLLPVHGVVQIGSNLGRSVLMRRDIARPLVLPFLLGSVAGVALGAQVVDLMPRPAMLVLLGAFVLWSVWSPRLRPARLPPRWFAAAGALSSFCTMFLGATGPLVASFLVPDPLTRQQVVATHAAFMTLQHGLKVFAFTALGFAFAPWLPMLALMIALGFAGTMAGRTLLDRMPEHRFARAFKLVLTALALKILADGVAGLLA
jgi:uncharacterized membrane protein YfcA